MRRLNFRRVSLSITLLFLAIAPVDALALNSFSNKSGQYTTDIETRYPIFDENNDYNSLWKKQSNADLSSSLERGDLKVSLGANLGYTEAEYDEVPVDQINVNNFLLEINYRDQRLAFGDLSVNGTELISNNISSRGGLVELKKDHSTAQFYLFRSDLNDSLDGSFSTNDITQRLFGGSLKHQWQQFKGLTVKGTAIAAKNYNPTTFNKNTSASQNDGQAFSLSFSANPVPKKLNIMGEIGLSRFDDDTTDDLDHEQAKALLLGFSGWNGTLNYGGKYKRLDDGFHSIAKPMVLDNRSEFTLYTTKSFKESVIAANCNRVTNNVDQDPLLPVIHQTRFDISYNLLKADWPKLFLKSSFSRENSTEEPTRINRIRNLSRTLTGRFTLDQDKWSLTPSYTFTLFEDEIASKNDSQIHHTSVALDLQPVPKLSLKPSLSWTLKDAENQALSNEIYQGALDGKYIFSQQDIFLRFSAADFYSNNFDEHRITTSYMCQYNWYPETDFLTSATKGISLSGKYKRIDDRIASSINDDYAISLTINFGDITQEVN